MARGSAVSLAASLRRLSGEPSLQLLRAELLPVAVAVLATHLGGSPRVVPAHEFLEQFDADLSELRGAGFVLPRTAPEYLGDWVRQGVVVRRPGEGREETLELSASAASVVRFVTSLDAPSSSVTSSRLGTVADLLERLARDSDPSQETRLEALHRQREALDAEIAEVEAGRFQPVADDIALERLADAMRLAGEIPSDFAQVSADLEGLNHDLREQIIRHAGSRGDVLEQIFSGVDVIEQSDAGRTFQAFYALVVNPDLAQELDNAVQAILERGFSEALTDSEIYQLRHLLTTLQDDAVQVRQVMTGFSRSLRRFVETHEYREHRRVLDALEQARSAALAASSIVRPFTRLSLSLETSTVAMSSIGTWTLHNPADTRTTDPVVARDAGVLDLEALRLQVRESEIDMLELQHAVGATLAAHEVVTIGQVLAAHPATQGLASIVGLLVLAHRWGEPGAGVEEVAWTSSSGQPRAATVRRYLFAEVPVDWRQAS